MADGLQLDLGTGGSVLATDEVAAESSRHFQKVKLADGTSDSNTAIAAGGGVEANALRVTLASDSTGVLSVDDNGGKLTVDWNGVDPPIGAGLEETALRVTIATDSTGVVSVDDNGTTISVDDGLGSLTVDGTVTANAGTNLNTSALALEAGGNLATIAGAVTGTEMQVDVVAALPAGTNNIGDVDVLSVVPGTGASNLGKADDAIHVTSDTGVMVLAVRDDAGGTLVSATGDYTPLSIDSAGALRVTGGGGGTEYTEDDPAAANPVGKATILVRQDTPATLVSLDGDNVAQRATNYGAAFVQILDSSGNFINTFGGSGGTSHADDALFTIGSASSITPMGALADDTAPDSVDEGDVGVPRMTLDRKLLTRIVGSTDGNRAEVDGSGHLQVDIAAEAVDLMRGTDFSNVLGTTAVTLAAGQDALANTADSLVTTTMTMVYNGASWDRLREGSEAGSLLVDLGANNDVLATGNVAHDAADSGNPLLLGARALAHGANPAAVAAADRTRLYANRHGIPWVIGGHPNIITESVVVAAADGAQADIAIASVGPSNKIVVTQLQVIADNANTVDVACRMGFGAVSIPAPTTTGTAGVLFDHRGIIAGGGANRGDGSGILGVGADGEDLRYTCDAPTGGNLSLCVSYYTIES